MVYILLLLLFFLITMFTSYKRTGKYRITKITTFAGDIHYQVEWEIMGTIGGPWWKVEMSENRPACFLSESEALAFVNQGVHTREIVKEGKLDNV